MDATFHCNFTQPHQIEHAQWFKKGLAKHNIKLRVTNDIQQEADVHIVSGPHYAKQYWLNHPKVILLDRALYHQDKPNKWHSMDWLSIGWMKDGSREFKIGHGRKSPIPKTRSTGTGTIFLADYNGPVEHADTVRLHPANEHNREPLYDALLRHAHAIGYNTTALVTAALKGLEVTCKDKRNIMYQKNWLEILPYADWRYSEIESGELWEHLQL